MTRIARRHVLGVAALIALVCASAAVASNSPNPVIRGNWERANVGDGFMTLSAGQAFGRELRWHVSSGDIDLVGRYWKAALGRQSVDLNGLEAGAIYRTFKTRPGTRYAVSFKISANPECGVGAKRMAVIWNGQQIGVEASNSAGKSRDEMKWRIRHYNPLADGKTARLEFKSLTAGACGVALDAVDIRIHVPGRGWPGPGGNPPQS